MSSSSTSTTKTSVKRIRSKVGISIEGESVLSKRSKPDTSGDNDISQTVDITKKEADSSIDTKDEEVMETNVNSLPDDFFDDPVMNAKVNKVVYKDPIDEQLELFQKEISEENNVSENIIVKDIEDLQIDKNLEEIEEQIHNWEKVNEMQKRAEILHNHLINKRDTNIKEEDTDSDVDESDLNLFSNWRSRTVIK